MCRYGGTVYCRSRPGGSGVGLDGARRHDHGACGSIVERLAAEGVGAVIAGGMGGGPRAGFAAAGIPVFFDPASPTPAAAVAALLAGERTAFDAHQCSGH